MSTFEVGDLVRGTLPYQLTSVQGTGVIIDIMPRDESPWPVWVRMDNGSEYGYAYNELEHVEEDQEGA